MALELTVDKRIAAFLLKISSTASLNGYQHRVDCAARAKCEDLDQLLRDRKERSKYPLVHRARQPDCPPLTLEPKRSRRRAGRVEPLPC